MDYCNQQEKKSSTTGVLFCVSDVCATASELHRFQFHNDRVYLIVIISIFLRQRQQQYSY